MKALICPLCKESLKRTLNCYVCRSRHSFDVAKQGYVNLLLPQQKHSKNLGDNRDMLLSRKHFLDREFFSTISKMLNTLIIDLCKRMKSTQPWAIVDVGCGEGFYLHRLRDAFAKIISTVDYYGLDISKEGIRLAAQRSKEITWIVGNANALPLQDQSVDFVMSMFAKPDFPEFCRVLKHNGILAFVAPDSRHLEEIRCLLYEKATNFFPFDVSEKSEGLFELLSQHKLTYPIHLTNAYDILSLLKMTPYYWMCRPEKRERALTLSQLQATVDVQIVLLQRLSKYQKED